jgi:hypothetical protein
MSAEACGKVACVWKAGVSGYGSAFSIAWRDQYFFYIFELVMIDMGDGPVHRPKANPSFHRFGLGLCQERSNMHAMALHSIFMFIFI